MHVWFYVDIFQFQFLYPFILEPMWMETSVGKQDALTLSNTSDVLNTVTTVHENQVISEKSENVKLEISVMSPLSAKELKSDSVNISNEVWSK